MRIEDSALGGYSILVGVNKYVVYKDKTSLITKDDFNDALREIARRIVADNDTTMSLKDFAKYTDEVFNKIKNAGLVEGEQA